MPAKISVGDTIKFTGKFLKSTGQRTGGAGLSKWIVVACECSLCKSGDFVATNEPHECQTDPRGYEDLAPEDRPKWRHINRANVYRVGTLDVRNDP